MARLRCACLDLQAFVSRLPTIGSVENAARFSTLRLNPGYSPHEGECGGFGFCGSAGLGTKLFSFEATLLLSTIRRLILNDKAIQPLLLRELIAQSIGFLALCHRADEHPVESSRYPHIG